MSAASPLMWQAHRELVHFARVLASYDCAGIDQEHDVLSVCGKCGPCEAGAWLAARGLLHPTPPPRLTPREHELAAELTDAWVRPMDVGGRDANDVHRVLAALVRKGYADVKRRGGHTRASYLYRRAVLVESSR